MSLPERPTSADLPPGELPPELADFLRGKDYVCITQETNLGTVLVIKVPSPEIQSVHDNVPIWLRQELYQHPAAPVIRLVIQFYDQPENPLAFEMFVNVADAQQRADFAALSSQEQLPMLFYDEALVLRLTKMMPYRNQEEAAAILMAAEQITNRLWCVPRLCTMMSGNTVCQCITLDAPGRIRWHVACDRAVLLPRTA